MVFDKWYLINGFLINGILWMVFDKRYWINGIWYFVFDKVYLIKSISAVTDYNSSSCLLWFYLLQSCFRLDKTSGKQFTHHQDQELTSSMSPGLDDWSRNVPSRSWWILQAMPPRWFAVERDWGRAPWARRLSVSLTLEQLVTTNYQSSVRVLMARKRSVN